MSTGLFISQVLPHEDTDEHEVIQRCGNLSIVHAPGTIQSYGALLVISEPDLTVKYASENTMKILGVPHENILNRNLSEALSPEAFQDLQRHFGSQNFKMVNPVRITFNGQQFNCILSRKGQLLYIDFEKVALGARDNAELYRELSQKAIMSIMQTQTIDDLLQVTVDSVREVTGFDRVMLYRFDEQYHGKVIAESLSGELPSFLNHCFPSWETPGPIRKLYMQTLTRYLPHIFDVEVKVAGTGIETTEGLVDLSSTNLRSCPRCHLDYMTNMGVGSSMSFSIVIDDRMWAMIACHKKRPIEVSYTHRLICEQVAGVLPDVLKQRENPEEYKKVVQSYKDLLINTVQNNGILQGLAGSGENLTNMVRATGAAVIHQGQIKLVGATPAEPDVQKLVEILCPEPNGLLYKDDQFGLLYTNNLSTTIKKRIPGGMSHLDFINHIKSVASGVIIVPLSRTKQDFLIFFRPEQVESAVWGGAPTTDTLFDEKYVHAPLNPKKSFETWQENVTGRSEGWVPYEVEAATQLRDSLLVM